MRAYLTRQSYAKEVVIEKALCDSQGKKFVEKTQPNVESTKVLVQIEYETQLTLTCSSEEEVDSDDYDVKSRKSLSKLTK